MKKFLIRLSAIPVTLLTILLHIPIWVLFGIELADHVFEWYKKRL